jgi:twitching motility two-component system response regulator PilH
MSVQHKILLVDEDAEFIRSTRELLEGQGYDVITAATGESGFQKVLKERPDMLVLDVAVAGKTALFESAHRVPGAVELRTMPVLLVAGASGPALGVEADKTWLPVGSVLKKPIDPAAFLAAAGLSSRITCRTRSRSVMMPSRRSFSTTGKARTR